MSKVTRWIRQETIYLLPIVIYFGISFNLIHFAQTLIMPSAARYTSYLGATIGAMIAGKVILVTDTLPFINAFPGRPALYNIISRFFIYGFFALLVQLLDLITRQWIKSGNWETALAHIVKNVLEEPNFWGKQVFILMVFLMYIVYSEVARVVGGKKMHKIIFGPMRRQ